MMKKLAIAVAVAVIMAAVVTIFLSRNPRRTTAAPEWPMGLGRMESVASRYPKQTKNEAAKELERLAAKAGVNFAQRTLRGSSDSDPITDYTRAQLQKTDRTIDPAPPIPDGINAVRAHLLSGKPIVWDLDVEQGSSASMPNVLAHIRLGRLLIANAFERARRGDAGAWDDLHAARELSRGMWQRPEIVSATVALSIDRFVLAAARKMPQPAPVWLHEMRAFDYRKSMMAAMQADTWLIGSMMRARGGDEGDIDSLIGAPFLAVARADFMALQREAAYELATVKTCGWDAQKFTDQMMKRVPFWNVPAKMATPNLSAAWQRLFRLQAELELTEHALGLRSGAQSQCADGQWIVSANAVKFSKPIEVLGGPATVKLPLEFTR